MIKGRCGKQCRERWVNILNPQVKKGNWSVEEQERIFQNLSLHYTSWSAMSKILPGRTENSIKNYFYSSVRRLKSNPLLDFLKEVYLDRTKDLRIGLGEETFVKNELCKFNVLSRKICLYLLDPTIENEKFTNFLLGVLLNKKKEKNVKNSRSLSSKVTKKHLFKDGLGFSKIIIPRMKYLGK